MATANPKRGRPSKFRPEFVEQSKKLAMLGLTDAEMAKQFGVSESTFHQWKHDYPEFSESLNSGKCIADGEVVAKLYHRAIGYEHPEDDIRVVNGEIVITPTVKHYPPDPTSMIFWLKNRQPARWRDKPPQDGDDEQPLPVKVEISVKDARIRDDDQSDAE